MRALISPKAVRMCVLTVGMQEDRGHSTGGMGTDMGLSCAAARRQGYLPSAVVFV